MVFLEIESFERKCSPGGMGVLGVLGIISKYGCVDFDGGGGILIECGGSLGVEEFDGEGV